MQHYYGNFTRSNNSNCKRKNAEPQENCIQKANTKICTKHMRKSSSPGFKSRSKPGQLALDNNSQRHVHVTVRQSNFLQFLKKTLTNQIRAVSRPSYVYVSKHWLDDLEIKIKS